MRRDRRITVRLSSGEWSRLEELCPDGMAHAAFVRELIRRASPSDMEDGPSHEEALRLLHGLARDGKVGAAVALEKALRPAGGEHAEDEVPDWLR